MATIVVTRHRSADGRRGEHRQALRRARSRSARPGARSARVSSRQAVKYTTRSWWRTARRSHDGAGAVLAGSAGLPRSRTSASAPGARSGESAAGEPLARVAGAGVPGDDQRAAEGVPQGAGSVRGQPLQRPARPRRADGTVSGPRRGANATDRVRGRRGRSPTHRRAPAGAGQTVRSSEHARAVGEGGARRVHDRPCVSAQDQPAARPAGARRARKAQRRRGSARQP